MNWSERELEDWLWAHPESLDPVHDRYEWIARQCRIGRWIADLVAVFACGDRAETITVIELKAHRAKPKDLLQLMRYMSLLRSASREWPQASSLTGTKKTIEGILIAPSFHEDVLLATYWTPHLSGMMVSRSSDGWIFDAAPYDETATDTPVISAPATRWMRTAAMVNEVSV